MNMGTKHGFTRPRLTRLTRLAAAVRLQVAKGQSQTRAQANAMAFNRRVLGAEADNHELIESVKRIIAASANGA